jgi:NodT family efflux transporter outer membrane factor (OMF) lipoprotein
MKFNMQAVSSGRSSRAQKQGPIGACTMTAGRGAFYCLLIVAVLACGCTGPLQYIRNGFKVGPNYGRPPAPVAREWIDANDVRVRSETDDLSKWWTVFNDPILDSLICEAYRQNLSLRVAGFRVLEARAQLLIDVGSLFPQKQAAVGDFTQTGFSLETANRNFSSSGSGLRRWFPQWDQGFNLSWELDFWGRFRRAVESDAASLNASVENYDDVLVTLLGDVASNYVQMRTFEQRIKYAEENVKLQQTTLRIVNGKVKVGLVDELDAAQARSTLEQTEAVIPELKIGQRQAANRICILLGMPPEDLERRLGPGQIPVAPPDVAVGIPADLLRRRPDVRRAERQAAAQSALIGLAESDYYPHIFINGSFTYSAAQFPDLFQQRAFAGTVGPSFTWNILNYGRILNNVRLQEARFQELVATYQNTVLSAAEDVENGLVTFLRAQEREKSQNACVKDADMAVRIALAKYTAGTIDLTRVTLLQQTLVQQQDTLMQAQGEIALGLIQTYRALGGGWQIRLTGCPSGPLPPPGFQPPPGPPAPPMEGARPEILPAPKPVPAPAPKPVPMPPPNPAGGVPQQSSAADGEVVSSFFAPAR